MLGWDELGQEERRVIELLTPGALKQKVLAKALGLNPVRLNKLLRTMEEAGTIKREPRGRENVVRLR